MQIPTYVIGDVHGCYHTLQNLVAKLPKGAALIFVGDLCDKGLYTKEVIEFVKQNNHRCVIGNHDVHMMMHLRNALKGEHTAWSTKALFSGDKTVASYQDAPQSLIDAHLSWLKTLPHSIEVDNYLITHGFGLPFYKSKDPKRDFYMRVNCISKEQYNDLYDQDYKEYGIINIFGHDSFDEVQIGSNYYAIDTDVKRGNKLTAIKLGSMKIIDTPTDKRDLDDA